MIAVNASAAITEDDYRLQYELLISEYEKLEDKYLKLENKLDKATGEKSEIVRILDILKTGRLPDKDFDAMMWNTVVEKMVVNHDDTVDFHLAGNKVYMYER